MPRKEWKSNENSALRLSVTVCTAPLGPKKWPTAETPSAQRCSDQWWPTAVRHRLHSAARTNLYELSALVQESGHSYSWRVSFTPMAPLTRNPDWSMANHQSHSVSPKFYMAGSGPACSFCWARKQSNPMPREEVQKKKVQGVSWLGAGNHFIKVKRTQGVSVLTSRNSLRTMVSWTTLPIAAITLPRKLKVFSKTHPVMLPGMKACNRSGCEVCPFVRKGKELKIPLCKKSIKINASIDCNSKNTVYCIFCNKSGCNKIYVSNHR